MIESEKMIYGDFFRTEIRFRTLDGPSVDKLIRRIHFSDIYYTVPDRF